MMGFLYTTIVATILCVYCILHADAMGPSRSGGANIALPHYAHQASQKAKQWVNKKKDEVLSKNIEKWVEKTLVSTVDSLVQEFFSISFDPRNGEGRIVFKPTDSITIKLKEEVRKKAKAFVQAELKREQNTDPTLIPMLYLNRQCDVVCLDNHRVKLQPGNRYIHANWIDSGNRRFYLTQAPLKQTVHSFWDMVVQENVDAIVMLTELQEDGREKCVPYWPVAEGDESRIAQFFPNPNAEVKFMHMNPKSLNGIDHRALKVIGKGKRNGSKKELVVQHFHWRNWPDYGVPHDPLLMLELLKELAPYKRIVVHCTAGVGRSGTMVAIQMALDKFHSLLPTTVSLPKVVQSLRKVRAGSVQQPAQYMFIYEVLLSHVQNDEKTKALALAWFNQQDQQKKTVETKQRDIRAEVSTKITEIRAKIEQLMAEEKQAREEYLREQQEKLKQQQQQANPPNPAPAAAGEASSSA